MAGDFTIILWIFLGGIMAPASFHQTSQCTAGVGFCTYVCIQMCACVYLRVCTYMHIYIYVHGCAYVYIYIYKYVQPKKMFKKTYVSAKDPGIHLIELNKLNK